MFNYTNQIKLKKFNVAEIANNLSALNHSGISWTVATHANAKTVKTFTIGWTDEEEGCEAEQYAVVILKAKCWRKRNTLYPDHLDYYPVTKMPIAQLWRLTDDGWLLEDANQWFEDSDGDEWMEIGDHLDTLLQDHGMHR
jgi:hypothetical protein